MDFDPKKKAVHGKHHSTEGTTPVNKTRGERGNTLGTDLRMISRAAARDTSR